MKRNPGAAGACVVVPCMIHCVVFPLLLPALLSVDFDGQIHQCCPLVVESNPNYQFFARWRNSQPLRAAFGVYEVRPACCSGACAAAFWFIMRNVCDAIDVRTLQELKDEILCV